MTNDKTMLRVQFAGRTITVQLFLGRGRRASACTEEYIRLIFFKGVMPAGRADSAVLPANLPVLFRILYNTHTGFHNGGIVS